MTQLIVVVLFLPLSAQLLRACVELAKLWRQDKMLRELDVSGLGTGCGMARDGSKYML